MKKAAIVYVSFHHNNTEKLIREAAKSLPIDLFTIEQAQNTDFSKYGSIGFASGVYAGRFHKSVFHFLKNRRNGLPKQAFTVCTSGVGSGRFAKRFSARLRKLGFTVIGEFECKGFNTFGPFKLFGGFSKGHPDARDIANGAAFLQELFGAAEGTE